MREILTNLKAHRLLYCLVQLRYLPSDRPYTLPGYLRRFNVTHWDEFNGRDIRQMAFQQARRTTCNFCDTPIAPHSTGDHLIPKAAGGSDNAANHLAMCRSHNSSKGAKDLIQWWTDSAPLSALDRDILCTYSRLRYQLCRDQGTLDDPAPPFLADALREELGRYATKDRAAILKSAGWEG